MKAPQLAAERKEYRRAHLLEADTPDDPIELFSIWMEEALAEVSEATAMALATCTDNLPSCRIVLLKGVADGRFTFFTNYGSRKGLDLAANPQAAATFYWSKLERQVRIEGSVVKLSREESESYFHSRPLESQISASISPQSKPVESRQALETLWQQQTESLQGKAPSMPAHWGGYAIVPKQIEFWQGGPGRLHDRILYSRKGGGWIKTRLAP